MPIVPIFMFAVKASIIVSILSVSGVLSMASAVGTAVRDTYLKVRASAPTLYYTYDADTNTYTFYSF